jgi:hypothetical protein
MTIEEIIKEAFSRGWNASHECATDFDYDCALNGFLSEVETEVKKFRIGAVMESDCDHEWINDSFDHFGFLTGQVCDKCGAKQSVP